MLVTTGEPWNPEPYRWLFEHVGGGRCPIINCSGGTEVGACFLSPTPAVPIKECSLGGPALGMAMDVVDSEGRPVRGEVGELVCRQPFPGMTRGFWRDPERYLDTYWRRLPGIWVHGDWALVDEDGFWFLHGRSDDTLNIAGKRLGPAELESAVVAHPAVAEAAAVGVPHEVKGEVAWVFCALVPGVEPSEELAQELRGLAAADLGKAFAPERVLFVSALPKTRSAKIVRRAVKAKALGERSGRPLVRGESRDPGGDRTCRNQLTGWTDKSRSSPAVDGGSARTSRASLLPPARESPSQHARATQVEEIAREIGGLALEVDVTDRAAVERMVAETERELGPIDLLAANAGIGGPRAPGRADPGEWWRMLEVNVLGVYLTCRAAIPGMLERGGGRIVITGSGAGYLPGASSTSYTSSKAAVNRLRRDTGQRASRRHRCPSS